MCGYMSAFELEDIRRDRLPLARSLEEEPLKMLGLILERRERDLVLDVIPLHHIRDDCVRLPTK